MSSPTILPTTPPKILPNPGQGLLTKTCTAIDANGQAFQLEAVVEQAITLYLNSQEIVTMMTVGDYPRWLALGYLRNQALLGDDEIVLGVEYDEELSVIIVRTDRMTRFEERQQKKIRTSGCALGTIYADVMDGLASRNIDWQAGDRQWSASFIQKIARNIPQIPSLYLEAGSIHGCVLIKGEEILAYFEDVGRHNAVDKIAGYMLDYQIEGKESCLYTTGRLTSEMVIKSVMMGIPMVISRSGVTEFGARLAQETGLTLVARARGNRFLIFSGAKRVLFDHPADTILKESYDDMG